MLIGMNPQGRITGVIMDRNTEPYGDISINLPQFPAQFKGKSIRDKFEVGQDVDVTSRATISVRAAAREIRGRGWWRAPSSTPGTCADAARQRSGLMLEVARACPNRYFRRWRTR
jgi:hypothetical protein